MRESIPKLWSRVQRPLGLIGAVALLALITLVVYWAFLPYDAPDGTGFVTYDPGLQALRPRTLWDWLELLIVPLVLALGALWFNKTQKETELEIAEKARKEDRAIAKEARDSDREIAENRQRQATLEAYYDRMTQLLLAHKLRSAEPDAEERSIARARTIAVIRSLDEERNRQLLGFLRASGLVERDAPVIDLRGADLSRAELSGAGLSEIDLQWVDLFKSTLSRANLSKANLSRANLSWASLFGADLSETNLSEADLSEANLSVANLHKANMREAKLVGANLAWANLSGANLSGANLSDASLRGANLTGADLSHAVVSGADLSQARMSGARMPDGVRLRDEQRSGLSYEEWLHDQEGQKEARDRRT